MLNWTADVMMFKHILTKSQCGVLISDVCKISKEKKVRGTREIKLIRIELT